MSDDSARVIQIRSGQEIASPGHPDQNVIDDLEMLLEQARMGMIDGLAWVAGYPGNVSGNHYVGAVSRSMVGSLFAVATRISKQLDEPS